MNFPRKTRLNTFTGRKNASRGRTPTPSPTDQRGPKAHRLDRPSGMSRNSECRRHSGFSLTVIAVLTLGIGINAAVFTMLKAIAITPIAGVPGSSKLAVVLRETTAGRPIRRPAESGQIGREVDVPGDRPVHRDVDDPVGVRRHQDPRTGVAVQVAGVGVDLP